MKKTLAPNPLVCLEYIVRCPQIQYLARMKILIFQYLTACLPAPDIGTKPVQAQRPISLRRENSLLYKKCKRLDKSYKGYKRCFPCFNEFIQF